jgi:hypothetical protein
MEEEFYKNGTASSKNTEAVKAQNRSPKGAIETPKSNISRPITLNSINSKISKHEIPSHVNFKKDNFTSSFIKELNPNWNKSSSSAYTNKSGLNNRKSYVSKIPP